MKSDPLIARIDAILPQTQCGQCGYPGCKPYATAIANGEADINQCPPGGDAGIRDLSNLLGVEYKPLNTEHGLHKPKALAVIDENICIGCTLCLQACPVDAILGAAKHMHTVIAPECTGCELCVAPCPVDCISMQPVVALPDNGQWRYPVFTLKPITLLQFYRRAKSQTVARNKAKEAADVARARYEFRLLRIEREKQERTQKHAQKTAGAKTSVKETSPAEAAKKAAITAAMERARAMKAEAKPLNTDNLPPAVQNEIAQIDARRRHAVESIQCVQLEMGNKHSEEDIAEVKEK